MTTCNNQLFCYVLLQEFYYRQESWHSPYTGMYDVNCVNYYIQYNHRGGEVMVFFSYIVDDSFITTTGWPYRIVVPCKHWFLILVNSQNNKHYSSISYLNVLLYLEVLETYRQQCIFLLKKRIFLLKIVEICKLSQNHINISDKGTKFSNKDKQSTVKHVLCDLPREHWNMVVTKYRVLINMICIVTGIYTKVTVLNKGGH